jgi:hypothetical protein
VPKADRRQLQFGAARMPRTVGETMSEEKLMDHLFSTAQENREIRTVKKMAKRHGDLEDWRDFANSMDVKDERR